MGEAKALLELNKSGKAVRSEPHSRALDRSASETAKVVGNRSWTQGPGWGQMRQRGCRQGAGDRSRKAVLS